MESATQLDLLKERIEYDKNIFGEPIEYYEFSNNEKTIYTLKSIPEINDMTYEYINNEMIEYKKIDSVNTHEVIENQITTIVLDSIVVDGTTFNPTENIINVYETYIKVLKRLLGDSKYIALSLRFPYEDYSEIELPKKYNNWQLRCAVEIYQGIGTEGIKSYSENGLSWTRDSGYISHELRGEIEPLVGVIKEIEENAEI